MVHFKLKILCTLLIMVVSATCNGEKQPVGSRMCKYHCGQFPGCTFCIFLIKRLVCTATSAKHPPQTKGEEAVELDFSKERLGSVSQRIGLCEEKISKIVLTRSNGFQYIKLKTEENAQLLVAQGSTSTKTPIHAFSLLNSSITTYHHIKPRYVSAMAYVPTLRQVLIAVSRKIQAFSLHTNISVTIRRRIHVLSIAVDDAQQLVFLALRSPYIGVTRMTPDGRYFKNVTCQRRPYFVCLDTRREILYVAGPIYICSFTYDGQGSQCITTSYESGGLTLGENGDVIYYIDKSTIKEVNLFKNETGRKVGKVLDVEVRCILFDKGYLYVSTNRNMNIYVWHDSNYSVLRGANPSGWTRQLIALMP